MMSPTTQKKLKRVSLTVLLLAVSMVYFVPIYWMIVSSIKPPDRILSKVEFIPRILSSESYSNLFSNVIFGGSGLSPFVKWYLNTIILTTGYVLVALAICTLGGYAFAQFDFKGKNVLFIIILITQMIPFHLMVVPLFLLIVKLRMVDTYIGGFLPIAVSPLGLFYMRQFMLDINKDLLDAARIDGASEYTVFFKVVLPLIKPGLAAMAIFFSMEYLNNLLWPLVAIRSESKLPLTVGIAGLVNQYKPRYGMVMAASTLATIPFIILFLLLRKQFEEGMGAMVKLVEK
jgi:ABC-type glycerol-3-phosphate transport system permease component